MQHARNILLLLILAVAALIVACGDVGPTSPASSGTPEIELATLMAAGSFDGPDRPDGSVTIEVGVDSELLPAFVPPDTLLFADHEFDDNSGFTARSSNTSEFDGVAANLANGVDGTAYVKMTADDGSSASVSGSESEVLTYAPGLTLTGPDLEGYTVTGIRIVVEIEVTRIAPQWRLAYEYTITILGH